MGDLIKMKGNTYLDIEPDGVLSGAIGKLNSVIVCGIDKNGELYTASSQGSGPESLWLAEKFKQSLLALTEGGPDA